MDRVRVHMHGGPLDGSMRPAPVGPDGIPAERNEFEYESESEGGLWYVEYRRDRHGEDGWHYVPTGIEQRADEE